jgi:hypothetical protein
VTKEIVEMKLALMKQTLPFNYFGVSFNFFWNEFSAFIRGLRTVFGEQILGAEIL